MGRSYSHLTKDERQTIYKLLDRKILLTQIAKIIGRNRSMLYRQVRRNYFHDREYPQWSGWSHELIAGRLNLEQRFFPIICCEAIFQFIYSRRGQWPEVYELLHRHRRPKRGGRMPACSHIPLYYRIKERTENIAKRSTFGHWGGGFDHYNPSTTTIEAYKDLPRAINRLLGRMRRSRTNLVSTELGSED